MLDDVGDPLPPLLRAQTFEAGRSRIILEGPALVIRQMAELHRLQNAINDHGGAKARSESEEQHSPAFVAAESLHQRVVDHLRRTAKSFCKIKADPATAEVMRLGQGSVVSDRSGISDRNDVVRPVCCETLDLLYYILG